MARVAIPSVLIGLGTTSVVAVATGSTLDPSTAPQPSIAASAATAAPRPAPPSRSTPTPTPAKPRVAQPTPAKLSAAKPRAAASSPTTPSPAASSSAPKREQPTSRSTGERPALRAAVPAAAAPVARPKVVQPSLKVVDTEYTRVALNVRKAADADAGLVAVLKAGSEVSVTATVRGDWQLVRHQGDGGWVRHQYLVGSRAEAMPKPAAPKTAAPKAATPRTAAPTGAASKTAAPTTGTRTSSASSGSTSTGTSSAACAGGSAVESGLTPDAIRLHRAICARFPGVTSFGGVRADSLPEHPSGRALDSMVSSSDLGWQIANWVRANAGQLGVSEVIFSQRIWTVQRGGEGWRGMSDRGSASANHDDHVHVTVYGSSGG